MASISSQHFYTSATTLSSTGPAALDERLSSNRSLTNNTQANNPLSSNDTKRSGSSLLLRSGEPVSLSPGQSKTESPTYGYLAKTLTPEKLNLDNFRKSLNNLHPLTGLTQSYEGTVRTYGPVEELNKTEGGAE